MKAIVLTQAGGAEQLSLVDCEQPSLQRPSQVLVRLQAAAINPIDTKIRQSPERFPVHQSQAILGCDGAGVIEQVGPEVSAFKVGDAVYFCQPGFNGRQGTYAEYAAVDQAFLAIKPSSLSFEQAAAAPLVLITAWEALFDRANLQAGQTVLIHAGAGGVGHVAIQLAKQAGAKVITTVSSLEKAAFVKSLGADEVILYRDEDVVDGVLAWTGGVGVDVVFDTVGGALIEQSFNATKVYGDVVSILGFPAEINLATARLRNLRLTQELMLSAAILELESAQQHQGDILKQCASLFDQGKLRIEVARVFSLAQATEAHRLLEQSGVTGKLVLRVCE